MDVQRCPHCELPFLENEVTTGNCPACLRSLSATSTAESEQVTLQPQPSSKSLWPLQVMAAALTALVVVLGIAVTWLAWPRDADPQPVPELQVLRESLKRAEKRVDHAAKDAEALRIQLKTAQGRLTALENDVEKTHKELEVLQSDHEKTGEKLTKALAELRVAQQRTQKAEKMFADAKKAKSRPSPLITFPTIPFPKLNIGPPK